jgi:hypothetical protein
MPKTKKTDLQVLRALLSLPLGKLTASEQSSFQAMYDQVATGRQLSLSPKQRAWADGAYDRHDLDKERPPARKVEVMDKSLLPSTPKSPLPLKPPGRK